MLFVTAGMGGGTGTGAAPVIAEAARERGILTVGVVTKPFEYEGPRRMRIAEKGIEELTKSVDTLIIIPNQNLFRIANKDTTVTNAFRMADEVLYNGVSGVTDLIVKQGRVNLDFADIKSVMMEMGKAMMGTGESEGEERALRAAEIALSNPLLDDTSIADAKGVIVNISGGEDMKLCEIDEIAAYIKKQCKDDVNSIIGHTIEDKYNGMLRVSVVASGIGYDSEEVINDNSKLTDIKPRLVGRESQEKRKNTDMKPQIKPKLVSKQSDLEDFLSERNKRSNNRDKLTEVSSSDTSLVEKNENFIPQESINPDIDKKELSNPFDEADIINSSKKNNVIKEDAGSKENGLISRLTSVREKAINVGSKAISMVSEVTNISKEEISSDSLSSTEKYENSENTVSNSEKIDPIFDVSNDQRLEEEKITDNSHSSELDNFMDIPTFLRRQRD